MSRNKLHNMTNSHYVTVPTCVCSSQGDSEYPLRCKINVNNTAINISLLIEILVLLGIFK